MILFSAENYQNDIANTLVEIASELGLDKWDWFAIIISSVSLIIALISVTIAVKTLSSQRKTEKNTQPIMNVEIQEFLLGQKLLYLLDSYVFLFALHFMLEKTKYKTKPSPHFWDYVEINIEDLNESLFYNDNIKFICFHELVTAFQQFSSDMRNLRKVLEDPECPQEYKSIEIIHIYEDIGMIMSAYCKTLDNSFGMDKAKMSKFLNDNFFNVFYTRNYNIYKSKHYNPSCQNDIALPYLENAESENFLNIFIEPFILQAIYSFHGQNLSLDTNNFIRLFFIHINVVIMNTWYHNKAFELKSIRTANNIIFENVKWEIKNEKVDEDANETSFILPNVPKSVKGWLFYLEDIKINVPRSRKKRNRKSNSINSTFRFNKKRT